MTTPQKKMLLMGSSAFKAELPFEVAVQIDWAIERGMSLIVGEAHGACRRFQDYVASLDYKDVVVGHAKSIRYNAGSWPTKQYGLSVKERERGMVDECDRAVVIWANNSGVIAENLEWLKKQGKPTYLYETNTKTGETRHGPLDLGRSYRNPYYRRYTR
jgi:hypothetical protein